MKIFAILKITIGILLITAPVRAAEVEKLQFGRNKVWLWQNGLASQTTNEVGLRFGILVRTNGTFTVAGGRTRQLEEGDILGNDGMLLKRDGSITPVVDHMTLNRGRLLVDRDGEFVAPDENVRLGNGIVIRPDRKIIEPIGNVRWILDGELFEAGGAKLPVRDTITMRDGRVLVQKDGSMLAVGQERNIMMNDGTKVYGDGTIIRFNGDRFVLGEGQIVVIEGVYVRPRP